VRSGDAPADERLIDAAVQALRHGEATGRASTPAPELRDPLPGAGSPGRTLATLRDAIADRAAVRIGYAGSDGTTLEHLLDPVAVVGGQLTAYDHRGGEVRTFAVSRITGVELLLHGAQDLPHDVVSNQSQEQV
jgi:predicted DNA-binding transcriptional regulator YafY